MTTFDFRFVFVQQVVAELGETAIEFPPMQESASFNLTRVKEKIEAAIRARNSQYWHPTGYPGAALAC
jgi:hypothetical protein